MISSVTILLCGCLTALTGLLTAESAREPGRRHRADSLYFLCSSLLFLAVLSLALASSASSKRSLRPEGITPAAKLQDQPHDLEGLIKAEISARQDEYMSLIEQPDYHKLADSVATPEQAAAAILCYCLKNGVAVTSAVPSLKSIHCRHQPIDCYGAAVIAASMLYDDGYQPVILSLRTSPKTYLFDIAASSIHAVFLYRSGDKFGYISLQNSTPAKFDDINQLIADVSEKMKVIYTQYFIFDLSYLADDFLDSNPGISENEIWISGDRAGIWDCLI